MTDLAFTESQSKETETTEAGEYFSVEETGQERTSTHRASSGSEDLEFDIDTNFFTTSQSLKDIKLFSNSVEKQSVTTSDAEGKPSFLRVIVHRASNLVPKDFNSYTDPYISVRLGGRRVRTRNVFATCNPTWEEILHIEVPKVLSGANATLRLTARDGLMMQARLLGLTEINLLEIWSELSRGGHIRREWCSLEMPSGKIPAGSRGRLAVSLSVVSQLDAAPKASALPGLADIPDVDLNKWNLRVTIHEARGLRGPIPKGAPDGGGAPAWTNKCCMTLRFGPFVHTTSYRHAEQHPAGAMERGLASRPGGGNPSDNTAAVERPHLQFVWNERFEIPLKEVASRLRFNAKIANHLIQVGNRMGFDRLFYDTREDVTTREELRFIAAHAPSGSEPQGREPVRKIRQQATIIGTGQYPVRGIRVLSSTGWDQPSRFPQSEEQQQAQGTPTKLQLSPGRVREAAGSSLDPAAKQEGSPGTEAYGAEADPAAEDDDPTAVNGHAAEPLAPKDPPTCAVALPEAVADWLGSTLRASLSWLITKLWQVIFGIVRREVMEGLEERHSLALVHGNEGTAAGEAASASGQQEWIVLDSWGGQVTGEVLVSFDVVEASKRSHEDEASQRLKAQSAEFEQWIAGTVAPTGNEYGDGAPMELLPPLPDGVFVDKEVDLPLHELFYQLMNFDSPFNAERERVQEIRDRTCGEWAPGSSYVCKQDLSYIIKLPSSAFGPKEAYTEAETVVQTLSFRGFVVQNILRNPRIVFGDVFYTIMQVAAVPSGPSRCRMQTSFAVKFNKQHMLKGVIQKEAVSGARRSTQREFEILKELIRARNGDSATDDRAEPLPRARLLSWIWNSAWFGGAASGRGIGSFGSFPALDEEGRAEQENQDCAQSEADAHADVAPSRNRPFPAMSWVSAACVVIIAVLVKSPASKVLARLLIKAAAMIDPSAHEEQCRADFLGVGGSA